MAKHQIAYYILEYLHADGTVGELSNMLNRVLTYINGLDKVQRKKDVFSTQDKFAYLHICTIENEITSIIFKSAKHSYSAPLVHKDTLSERPNPKLMEEGEQVITHIVVNSNSGYVTNDTMQGGVTMNAVVNYLNAFLQNVFEKGESVGKFEYSDVPSDSFRDEIDRLDRVSFAEVITDKQILGSPALGYNERTEEVQEDISITLKAKKCESIKSYVLRNLLPSMNNNKIRRIKIKGKDVFGNDRTLDSLKLLKKTYVDVVKDELTGEFDSQSMFAELKSALPILQ